MRACGRRPRARGRGRERGGPALGRVAGSMAGLLLKTLALWTVRTEGNCVGRVGARVAQRAAPRAPAPAASAPRPACLTPAKAFGTAEDAQEEGRRKRNEAAFSSIGRKISERVIHVLDEKGGDLGSMHRADVIRLMDARDLRLVRRDTGAGPPVYQLLTGAQIHEERLRLRAREKARPRAGPTVTKELTFSSNIGQHDLDTKSKQIQQWIEKKYRVQITVKKAKNAEEPEKMDEIFNHILQTMSGTATFSSRPQAVKGGKAVTCILRHLSEKEEITHRETRESQKGGVADKESGNGRESDVPHQ